MSSITNKISKAMSYIYLNICMAIITVVIGIMSFIIITVAVAFSAIIIIALIPTFLLALFVKRKNLTFKK